MINIIAEAQSHRYYFSMPSWPKIAQLKNILCNQKDPSFLSCITKNGIWV